MRSSLLACVLVCVAAACAAPVGGQIPLNEILPAVTPAPTPVPPQRERPLRVVATTGVLADVARQIAGDLAVVTSLMPASADLHTFEPSADDVTQLATADLVIVNGLGLEGWLDRLIANSGYKGAVVVASKGVEPLVAAHDDDHDHHHDHGDEAHDHVHAGGVDPHAWTDVMAMARYTTNIAEALAAADGHNAEEYASRAELYTAQLKVLHNWVLRETSKLTPEQRVLVMDHDAMGYFARRYGFEMHTLRGTTTREEPNAQDMAELVEFMRQHKVRSLYVESAGNRRLAEQIAAETGARLGEPLLVHAPAPCGEPGDDYLSMTVLNVSRVVRGAR